MQAPFYAAERIKMETEISNWLEKANRTETSLRRKYAFSPANHFGHLQRNVSARFGRTTPAKRYSPGRPRIHSSFAKILLSIPIPLETGH